MSEKIQNFENTEGEINPAILGAQENYEMPQAVTVNGEVYDSQLLSALAKSFEDIVAENENLNLSEEERNDATAIAAEVAMVGSEVDRSPQARMASIANALATPDLEQETQAKEAQEIVAGTEGEKGVLERLSEKKKKLVSMLALISGLGAAAPASAAWIDGLPGARGGAQSQRFDFGGVAEALGRIGVEVMRRGAQNEIGRDEEQARRQLEQGANEERLRVEAEHQLRELEIRHAHEKENFDVRRSYELESRRLRNENPNEIRRYEGETQMIRRQMELRHEAERRNAENNFRRRVEEGRIQSSRRAQEIEIQRQRERGNIGIESRTRGVEEAMRRIFR